MRLRVTILFALLTGLVLGIGWYFGGQQGALWALAISAVMNLGTYWFSDKLVLAMYRAKEASAERYGELHRTVEQLANGAGLPKPRLYLIDTPMANAFATGRNAQHAVVAVTTGILSILTPQELRAVLAHELSHVKNRDILVSSMAATLAGAVSYLAQTAYFFGGSRDSDNRNPIGMIAFLILTPLIATLLQLAVSRSREYLADESGAHLVGHGRDLASALTKLHTSAKARPLMAAPKYEATAHLFIVNPFKASFLTSLFSTHPPMEERVKRLLAM